MEIENISVHHATRKRDDNNTPILTFEENNQSQELVITAVTRQF